MAEYITNKQSNYGWSLTWDAAGRFPIIAKRRFATLADAQAFVDDKSEFATATEGLIISVINDTGNTKNNGVYYIKSVANNDPEYGPILSEGTLVKVGGTETEDAENYSAAVALSTGLTIGQLIKVLNAETITVGEKELTYQAGFYIVETPGTISALATSTGSDDEVGALKARVDTIEGDYITSKKLKEAIDGIEIPEVPVKDVEYGGKSLLDESGVADLSDFAKTSELEAYVPTNGYVAYSDAEKTKLEKIEEGAEVNYVKFVGDNLSVDNTGKLTVSFPEVKVPFQSVDENDKVLTLDSGVLSSTINLAIDKDADENGKKYIRLTGKDGVELGAIDTTDFVVDGMLESVAEKEGEPTTLVFTWNSAAGITTTEIDFSKYVDTYAADGSTLVLGADNKTFSVKENVFDAYGAANKAEENAKDYADTELANKADKATTLSGYSITDAYTKDEVDAELDKKVNNDTFETVSNQVDTNKTNIEAITALIGDRAEGDVDTVFAKLTALANGKADKATTLAGYGITDAYTKEEANDLFLTGITAGSGTTVVTDNENKSITVDAKISKAPYNMLTVNDDGLFVNILIDGDDIEVEKPQA